MLKHVAVSPHRARADSVSLSSSASCCSLGSLEHRHDSVGDLSNRTTFKGLFPHNFDLKCSQLYGKSLVW
ncbi:unnamed protein product [Colias eurytheme]|nr:unnamed protein product [Colias eurytheme]